MILFLDFDGTLVGFKRNPKEVRVDASARQLLERFSRHPRVMLVFISGRRRADLRRRVAVQGAHYLGLHGWESGTGIRVSATSRRSLQRVRQMLRRRIHGLAGVWIEDKQASLALHYRGAPPAAAASGRAAVREVLKIESTQLRVLRGKKIWELLPPEVEGKGAAAAEMVRAAGRGVLPVYFGDDETDETAFAAFRGLEHRDGVQPAVTVRVGSGKRTWARYRVRNVDEVKISIERLATALL